MPSQDLDKCPITDIKFFDGESAVTAAESEQPDYWEKVLFHEKDPAVDRTFLDGQIEGKDIWIGFTKKRNQLPLTNLKIDGDPPCQSPGQSIRPNLYPTEINRQRCEFGVDLRFEDSGMVDLNEYDLMLENGLLGTMEYLPSVFVYGGLNSYTGHYLKTFNRPTGSWLLECENDGRTIEEALKKIETQLEISYAHEHVGNVGIAIVVIFPFLCCSITCCTILFKSPGPIFLFLLCKRIFWIILGIIIMVYLDEMRQAAEINKNQIVEFEIVNQCAEKQHHIDIAEIQTMQENTLEKTETLWMMSLVAFFILAGEVFCAGCAFCCAFIEANARRPAEALKQNCSELGGQMCELVKLVKHGG